MSDGSVPTTAARGPLAGLAVVEAVSADAPAPLMLAAGLAGRIAADLGADVTRLTCNAAARPEDPFLLLGKDCLEVTPSEWGAALADLAPRVDAVICDPKSERRMPGFGEALLVVLGMSRDAPLNGSELTIEARSGLLDLVGDPDRSPLRLGGHQTAYAGGLAAYLALTAGLVRRRAGETAGPMRVNLLDVAVWLNWKTLGLALRTGVPPHRAGDLAEWIVVACTDGHAAVVYRQTDWPRLLTALDDPRLADPRFATPAGRDTYRRELNDLLVQSFSGLSRARVHELAIQLKLPLGPVWTPEELFDDPQMLARRFFRPAMCGLGLVPGLPAIWNGRRLPEDAADEAAARSPAFAVAGEIGEPN